MVLRISGLFLAFFLVACGSSTPPPAKDGKPDGVYLYTKNCAPCHGKSGDKGINGAKNLQETLMNQDEIIALMKTGKGVMPSFQQLSDEEMKAVAEYVETLK